MIRAHDRGGVGAIVLRRSIGRSSAARADRGKQANEPSYGTSAGTHGRAARGSRRSAGDACRRIDRRMVRAREFCRNASNELIETTTTDTTCTGTTVIASNVTAFSAQLPSGAGPVDKPAGVLSLTLTHSAAAQAVTLTTSVRLGGGTL